MTPYTTSNATEWTRPVERPALIQCPDCSLWRRDTTGPHAPRRDGARLVDCAGREVAR